MDINLKKIKEIDGACLTENVEVTDDQYELKPGQIIQVQVQHHKGDVYEVTGSAMIHVTIPCDRCLTPVDVTIPVDLSQTEDVTPYLEGDLLHVDQMIHDEILVGWPMKILCSEDCPGIPGGYMEPSPDPRMAAIQDIFSKSKEV